MFLWSIILIATNNCNTEQKEDYDIQQGTGSSLCFPNFWLQDFKDPVRGIPGLLQKCSCSSFGTDAFIFQQSVSKIASLCGIQALPIQLYKKKKNCTDFFFFCFQIELQKAHQPESRYLRHTPSTAKWTREHLSNVFTSWEKEVASRLRMSGYTHFRRNTTPMNFVLMLTRLQAYL